MKSQENYIYEDQQQSQQDDKSINLAFKKYQKKGATNPWKIIMYYKSNCITDYGIEIMKKYIYENEKLSLLILDFEENKITQTGLKMLLQLPKHLKNLKRYFLSLKSNKFEFGKLCSNSNDQQKQFNNDQKTNLQALQFDFSQNKLDTKSIKYVCQLIKSSPQLKEISLSMEDTDLSYQKTDVFKNEVFFPQQLEIIELIFGLNNLTGDGIQNICNPFKACQELKQIHLDLHHNIIGDDGIRYLFSYLSQLQNLSQLKVNLENNMITNRGANIIGKLLEEQSSLLHVDIILRNNLIDYSGAKILSKSIKLNKKIRFIQLNLSDFNISKQEKIQLSMLISKSQRLIYSPKIFLQYI
ncbi:kinase domain protein (macronuclear) [Tetrahymena thermophila SB210]|uniref:Kinase domain protein n=1 Tax=Tetrahymena thermophila (strain SB210) TaxID=312017 RepID=A4VE31_TETTS|nr:kinase domain protein [Tetrahymena thermophila SB210]EDK31790.2 kinase domain protein [Tetrahymena thermophila SB210]|eukprot:XP_001471314.2 kinase domain protein [Tetrahymena thermophila SB210]